MDPRTRKHDLKENFNKLLYFFKFFRTRLAVGLDFKMAKVFI